MREQGLRSIRERCESRSKPGRRSTRKSSVCRRRGCRGASTQDLQPGEEVELREGQLGPAERESMVGPRTASDAGQASRPASPRVLESKKTSRKNALRRVPFFRGCGYACAGGPWDARRPCDEKRYEEGCARSDAALPGRESLRSHSEEHGVRLPGRTAQVSADGGWGGGGRAAVARSTREREGRPLVDPYNGSIPLVFPLAYGTYKSPVQDNWHANRQDGPTPGTTRTDRRNAPTTG